ncbi:MAG TPA: membrane protein insertion efficiency factor YidD [Verrucomicrobiae bacterium]|nr:membrane protein insertion efficiency factor YidD [Verrucomicrobiae bacterium]
MSKSVSKTARWMALAGIRVYQIFFGPVFGGACRFEPSCSAYAYEAIQRFGAARGTWLGMKRLLRCRPFSPGGYDPVPKKSEFTHAEEKSQRVAGPHDGRAVEVLR